MKVTERFQGGRTLELRHGASLMRTSHAVGIIVLGLLLSMLMVVVVLYVLVVPAGEPMDVAGLMEGLSKYMDEDSAFKWQTRFLVAFIPVGIAFLIAQRFAYLRLNQYGLEGYVPRWVGLGLLRRTTGHWQIPWEAIRSVRLVPGKNHGGMALQLSSYRLVIETDGGQTRLAPFFWILRGGPDHRLTLRQALPSSRDPAEELIENAPLVQELRTLGFEVKAEPGPEVGESGPAGYDLAKHPGLVVQLVLLFVAGSYALAEVFVLQSYQALEPLPMLPFVLAALAGGGLAGWLGKGAPVVERSAVGLLTVVALTMAVYPGLLRFNAMTAEPRQVVYRSIGLGEFEPVIPGVPAMDLRALDIDEYWQQYSAGAEYEFKLLRGAGGFYQVDLAPLFERTREFYSERR